MFTLDEMHPRICMNWGYFVYIEASNNTSSGVSENVNMKYNSMCIKRSNQSTNYMKGERAELWVFVV